MVLEAAARDRSEPAEDVTGMERGTGPKRRKPKTYFAAYSVAPVRAYVLAKDLDIKTFADQVGINREELYRYWTKNGDRRRKVSEQSAQRLADFTKIPKAYWKGESVTIKVTKGR